MTHIISIPPNLARCPSLFCTLLAFWPFFPLHYLLSFLFSLSVSDLCFAVIKRHISLYPYLGSYPFFFCVFLGSGCIEKNLLVLLLILSAALANLVWKHSSNEWQLQQIQGLVVQDQFNKNSFNIVIKCSHTSDQFTCGLFKSSWARIVRKLNMNLHF